MEAVECGAASLSMVLQYYGTYRPLEELRLECGVSKDGSKASNILKAARNFGFTAKGFRKEPEELLDFSFPAIIFWEFNHFVVLEGFNKKKEVFLNDPASGKRVVSWEEFDKSFTGIVLTFEKGQDYQPSGKKPSTSASLVRRFKRTIPLLSVAVIAGVLLTFPGLMVPVFSKVFIDNYLVAGLEEWVLPLILFMIGTAIVTGALNFIQQFYLLKMQNKLSISDSSRMFWYIVRLPMDFFNQRMAGDISNRISLNDEVASMLSGQLAVNIIGIFSIFFYIGLMFYYDVVLTLISVAFILFNALLFQFSIRKISDYSKKVTVENAQHIGVSMSGVQNVETIKARGQESDFFINWSGLHANVINTKNKMVGINQLVSVIPALFTSLNVALILYFGSIRVMDGYMTMGMLVAFQSLMQSLSSPINNLLGLSASMKQLEGSMSYIDDVFNYPVKDSNMELNTKRVDGDKAKLDGKIELKNVVFGYSKVEPPLITDFSLTIEPGERVAIVGYSGCGKSTFAKFLSGLYEAWDGEVLFDGVPVDRIDKRVFNNSVSMVDQDISMFNASIKDNISLWDDSIPEPEIIKACKDACIHDDIVRLHNAYETVIEEGGRNFSGGQKQRIELARSFVQNPTILILDEATSALDTLTESKIDKNLHSRGCTCVIIAHRLSTIRDADKIVVLDQGSIVQVGTHDELKDVEGVYSNLIKG